VGANRKKNIIEYWSLLEKYLLSAECGGIEQLLLIIAE
jgi:hypothetical protein